jgi:RNA polymerase sigma factor (sigma-70 family)
MMQLVVIALIEVAEQSMVSYQNDDPGAPSWDRLISCSRPALLAHAYRILHDPDGAEDVVQDVLLGAIARDPTLQDTPLPYLRTAVRNRAIDVVRQRHAQARLRERERPPFRGIAAWDPARIDQRRLYAGVIRYIQDLPEPERATAKLRWWEGMSCGRIARILGMREKSAQRLVARVRRKIRNACEPGG